MKQIRQQYFKAIIQWDARHRIIGKEPIETLYRQSLRAVRKFREGQGSVVVDIGAGSGILGIVWLFALRQARVAFVEPDKKKAAFLRSFVSVVFPARSAVFDKAIQKLSRDELDRRFGENSHYLFVARAFSSEFPLDKTLSASWIAKEPVFVFEEAKPDKFLLRKLNIFGL